MTYLRLKRRSYELLGEDHSAVYGEARDKHLKELAQTANSNHFRAQEHWRGYLDCARQAGIALLHARKILGGRSKWSKWRRDNFEGSKETCNQYMRVAKFWDDPRIVEARKEATINSIEGFLKVIRNSRQKAPQEQGDRDWFCKDLKRKFGDIVRTLSEDARQVYHRHFDKIQDELVNPFLVKLREQRENNRREAIKRERARRTWREDLRAMSRSEDEAECSPAGA